MQMNADTSVSELLTEPGRNKHQLRTNLAPTEQHLTLEAESKCKVYKRRWLMLILFLLTSSLNAIHWLQYSIIANITMKYYNVTATIVNWSAMISMVVYIPLVLPATWVLEKKGLRFGMLAGGCIMTLGAWLKLLSLDRNKFYVGFIAQLVIGSAQMFILSVPSRLAGLWFESKQVSTACAIGVFGNQLGIAIGFMVPPIVVLDSEDMNEVHQRLAYLYYGYAIPPTLLLVLLFIFFEDSPKYPPSKAQVNVRDNVDPNSCWATALKELFKNKDFVLLLFSYGINVGVFYAYSTLLNQLILNHYPTGEKEAGQIGLTLIIGGAVGSVIWGIFLDKTHKFKFTAIVVYCMAFLGMLAFTFALDNKQLVLIYVTSAFLGFFMNGYLTVAYEFACELTYPLAESTSTGVLTAVGELVGVTLVLVAGEILEHVNDLVTDICLTCVLLVGLVVSAFISGQRLNRLAAGQMT